MLQEDLEKDDSENIRNGKLTYVKYIEKDITEIESFNHLL